MKDMRNCRLASWERLPSRQIHEIFPDAVRLGQMSVDFGSIEMDVYRFKDAAGNDAFAFDKGTGLMSHGSHILTTDALARLKKAGADVGGAY